jgi:hypothetical protein
MQERSSVQCFQIVGREKNVLYQISHTFPVFNPLNAELNPTCLLLALLEAHILHVGRVRVKQNYEKRLLASSCLSALPHGTTWLPLDGFLRNLIFEDFSKMYRENSSSIKIGPKKGYRT